MNTYISLLKGINVAGKNKIKMDALRNLYESLQCKNVTTYVQSGNVIFKGEEMGPLEWGSRISKKIQIDFGFEVPVIVMETERLQQIVRENPFVKEKNKDAAFFHVTFLGSTPLSIDIDTIALKKQMGEEIAFTEKAIYLYCPNGYGKTKLNNAFLENKMQVTASTRNWKSTNALMEIALRVTTL